MLQKIADNAWEIALSQGYKNRGVLRHELYHVFDYETRRFPLTDHRLLRMLLFIDVYAEWKANEYALTGKK